eukprot:6214231-Pleurochrysis_carterae.AAC.3
MQVGSTRESTPNPNPNPNPSPSPSPNPNPNPNRCMELKAFAAPAWAADAHAERDRMAWRACLNGKAKGTRPERLRRIGCLVAPPSRWKRESAGKSSSYTASVCSGVVGVSTTQRADGTRQAESEKGSAAPDGVYCMSNTLPSPRGIELLLWRPPPMLPRPPLDDVCASPSPPPLGPSAFCMRRSESDVRRRSCSTLYEKRSTTLPSGGTS